MSRNWDALDTFADWSGTLHELLAQATQAIQSGDIHRKVAVQDELNQFIMHSPNHIARQLDDIAGKAVHDIFIGVVGEALANIASRSAELSLHVKTVNAVTAEAQAAARSIRLEAANRVIDSATAAVRNLVALRDAVRNTTHEQVLATKIEKAVKALQDLVPSIMAAGGSD